VSGARSGDPWVLAQTASYYDNSPAAHMLQLIVGRISIKCTPADHSFGRSNLYIHGAHIETGLAAAAVLYTFVMPPRRLRAKLISSNLRLGSIFELLMGAAREMRASSFFVLTECLAFRSLLVLRHDCRSEKDAFFPHGARTQATLPLAY
jgi:hypothetical protein